MPRHDAALHQAAHAPEREETYAQSGRKELPKRAETFLNWCDTVITNEEVEAVHKMRVASRRLRATMDAYESICQARPFKKAYRTVKKAADLLGAARDTDVMMQEVSRYLEGAPEDEQAGPGWLLERLRNYRQECQHHLETFLAQVDEHLFKETIVSCLPQAASKGKAKHHPALASQAPTGQSARSIAQEKLDELYGWDGAADQPYAVRELHHLRIAAKRLRYTLEIFEAFLPDECKLVVKEVEQIQEELGQLHDCDVMIALLRLCLGSLEHPIGPQALAAGAAKQRKPKPFLPTALVLYLIKPAEQFSAAHRYGLEQLLRRQEHLREAGYSTFRQHWYHLKEQDMRRQVLTLLKQEPALA